MGPRLVALLLLAPGCGATAGASEAEPVPTDGAELAEFLSEGQHEQWDGWSRVGPTLGSGGARVFLSPQLFDSLASGETSHPIGAAAVRELYADDFATLTGYSVLIKVEHGTEPSSWSCFEWLDLETTTPQVAERGAPGCVGCHGAGTDFIRSTLPLP